MTIKVLAFPDAKCFLALRLLFFLELGKPSTSGVSKFVPNSSPSKLSLWFLATTYCIAVTNGNLGKNTMPSGSLNSDIGHLG